MNIDQFHEAVRSMGLSITNSEFQELMAILDKDDSGEIELDEFRDAVKMMRADVTSIAIQGQSR